LTKINEFTKNKVFSNGIFLFVGFNADDEFICKYIIPTLKSNLFLYKCCNRFYTDYVEKYLKSYDGSIIFANGNDCFIYEWNNQFIKKKHINANLIKRQKKGGQSSIRFARLAEESRLHYCTHVLDYINKLETTNNYIFGSNEIIKMIMSKNNENKIKLINGGFLEFDNSTINDTDRWLNYIKNENINYDKYYEKIIFLLNNEPDKLCFDIENKNENEFYILNNETIQSEKQIPLLKNSIYYHKLAIFDYIGVKYYTCLNEIYNEPCQESHEELCQESHEELCQELHEKLCDESCDDNFM